MDAMEEPSEWTTLARGAGGDWTIDNASSPGGVKRTVGRSCRSETAGREAVSGPSGAPESGGPGQGARSATDVAGKGEHGGDRCVANEIHSPLEMVG